MGTALLDERIGQKLPGSLALLLMSPLFGYAVALHHETDHRFVHHFIERRLGATLSVTPHVSSAIGV
jgi:hypothetical protein